jgi:hypothetical protein
VNNRKEFNLDYINSELERLGDAAHDTLRMYAAGGYVMASMGLKAGTKDIDVVVQSRSESEKLQRALENSGYTKLPIKSVTQDYRDLSAAIYENRDGFRWDVFNKTVANKLSLSKSMRARAELIHGYSNISLFELSREDIFLMKGVTDRERDLDDMLLIARAGVDYKTVFNECLIQSEATGKLWEMGLYEKCSELQDRFGLTVPITRKLRKVAEEKMLVKRILKELKKGRTQEELVTSTKLKPTDIRAGVRILKREGRIRISKNGKIKVV